MGGKNNLYVRVKLDTEIDQTLLPLEMERHLGLVHKQYVRLVVLDQYGEKNDEHLLFATRQLIGQQHLAYLGEAQFVLGTDNFLARFAEQVIYNILETRLFL